MLKYAYILNCEGCTPENYSGNFVTDEIEVYVIGTSSMDMVLDSAKKLVQKGVTEIDLCGDFDEEKSTTIRNAIDGKADVSYVRYYPPEAKLLDKIDLTNFGFLVMHESLNPDKHIIKLSVPACNLKVIGVPDLAAAVSTVNAMQEEGSQFFELCRAFTDQHTRNLICETGAKSAIGSAGIQNQDVDFLMRKITLEEVQKLGSANWETWEEYGPGYEEWYVENQDTSFILEGQVFVHIRNENYIIDSGTIVMFPQGETVMWIVPKYVKKIFTENYCIY